MEKYYLHIIKLRAWNVPYIPMAEDRGFTAIFGKPIKV